MEVKFSPVPTNPDPQMNLLGEKEEEEIMPKEFEETLTDIGSFGKYQKNIVFFILFPISYIVALSINMLIFQTVVPEYWCDPAGRETTNFTQQEWWNLTVPRSEDGKLEKCHQYELEMSQGIYLSTNSNSTIECRSRWDHDRLSFFETMATAKEWLCELEIYSTHIFSITIAGNAVGTLVLPTVADKYTGRKLMFFIANGIYLTFNALSLIVNSFFMLLTVRFIAGLSFPTIYQMPYIISLELTSPNKRAMISFISFIAWTCGMCSTALISWLIPHWWYLVLINCIPSTLFFAYWTILPKSPRWLLSKGKICECKKILLKVARTNGINVDGVSLEKKLRSLTVKEEKLKITDLLHFKRMVLNGILVTLLSFAIFMAYGCTWMNVKILPNNYFLSYFILSVSELPSNIIGFLSVNYLGRRSTAIFTSAFLFIFSLVASFLTEERIYLLVVVAMIKIFATAGMYLSYVIATEVFPTPIRSTGMGIVLVAGTLGVMLSPYVVTASKDGPLQYWVMMGLGTISFLLALPLPETIGLALPQTFQEANDINQRRPFFKWIHHWNMNDYPGVR